MMRPLFLALALAAAGTAHARPAAPPVEHGPGDGAIVTPDGHGEHAAPEAAHDASHAEHHVTITGDDDHDGTANWMDPESEAYSLIRLASQAISFLIVVGVLIVYGRPAIVDFVKNRALAARKQLVDSAKARTEAHDTVQGLEARLASIEAEIGRIQADAEIESASAEAKLVARAQEEAARIGSVAERKIRDEVNRARTALRAEAVELAVQLAERTLRGSIGPADQQRLAREFLESLKNDEGGLRG